MKRTILLLLALLAALSAAYAQPGFQITSGAPPNGDVGSPYSFTFTATGGTEPYSWSITSPNPQDLRGLSLNSANNVWSLSGTPTSTGAVSFDLSVFDSSERFAFQSVNLTINPALVISTTSPLPEGAVGVNYGNGGFAFQVTGGQEPYTWSVVSGSTFGLTLSNLGLLSGAPTTAGTSTVTIQVRDGTNAAVQKPFILPIATGPLTITNVSPMTTGESGFAYSYSFNVSGGVGPYSWALASGTNPAPGLSLNSATGVLSGIPTQTGTFTYIPLVTDNYGNTFVLPFNRALALSVTNGPTITNVGPMPATDSNVAYSYTLNAIGGVAPYTWSLGSGTNPAPGLNLNPQTGVLSGIATATGTFTYVPRVTDSLGYSFTLPLNRALSLSVSSGPSISSSPPPPSGTVGVPYSYTFSATGGIPAYTWGITAGTLPPGLSFSGTGSLSGTPTSEGSYSFTVQVRDSANGLGSASFVITINPKLTILTTSPLGNGVVGTVYRAQFTGKGGQLPYTWSGSPPAGLELGSSGALSGTPTTAGTFSFAVTLTDAQGGSVTAPFSITITGKMVITSQSPLPDGNVGVSYGFTFGVSGAVAPVTWSIAGGSAPGGLTLDSATGSLSGTPSTAGTSTFGMTVTDSSGQTASATFSLTVLGKLLITTTSPLPDGKVGSPYSAQLAATGGVGTLTWSVQSGSLPAGLSLSGAGLISGTPTATGAASVTVQVTDSTTPTAQTASQTFSITIAQSITITTTSLPQATAGTAYSASLAATGGTAPYNWKLSAGSLPSGLTLDGTSGAISGTPKVGGSFAITVGVSDTKGASGSKAFSLTVSVPGAPSLTITNLPSPGVPNQQPQFQMALEQPYPLDITGQLQLTFTSLVGVDDPMIRFANGTRLLNFTVPANTMTPVFGTGDRPVLLTGTTAGTITLTVTVYQAGGQDVQPVPPPVTIQIAAGPPVITSVTATRNSSGFTVRVAGFTTQRQVTKARFQFNGTNLQTTEVSPAVDTLFSAWFQSTQSNQFGTQFSLTQPFNVQGDPQTVTSVTVTLSSAAGDSSPVTAQLQ